jgi:hypothetical protein
VAPATGTAILILAAFVLPGFVALRYRERTVVVKANDSQFERLLSALLYSSLSYLVVGAFAILVLGIHPRDTSRLWHGRESLHVYLLLGLSALVVPVLLSEIVRWWSNSRVRRRVQKVAGMDPAHTTPSGWEHFFLRDRTCFVLVTLKDGRLVGGRYGEHSFAGYTAETPDLYIEERWPLENGWFPDDPKPVEGTLGMYIRADQIVSVEFYDDHTEQRARKSWWRRLKYLFPWVDLPGQAQETGVD